MKAQSADIRVPLSEPVTRKAQLTVFEHQQAGGGSGVWAMEQAIGFLNISVNIRMTVIRLADGSLLVSSWSRLT